jgi:glycosyltransferase involved in cell wall biosynthesis
MRVLIINSVCGTGSHGRICAEIAREYEAQGHTVKIAYGRYSYVPADCKKYAVRIGNDLDLKVHAVYTRLTDKHGFASKTKTKKFLQWADEYNPDLLWLHNIHGYYINVQLLFEWIKGRNVSHPDMQIKWTLHDCWTFTGHCAYFTACGCEKWKTRCEQCTQTKDYPSSVFADNSIWNYEKKKELFTGARNLMLITPSKWLADLTRESFLQEYPVEVHYNTVDESVFHPTESRFREKYHLEDKRILLGVTHIWDERKGLDDLLQLICMLDDSYALVLVGLTQKQIDAIPDLVKNTVDKLLKGQTSNELSDSVDHQIQNAAAQWRLHPNAVLKTDKGMAVPESLEHLYLAVKNAEGISVERLIENCGSEIPIQTNPQIICIAHTESQKELAEIYTASDLFINPTHEDNYPTTNLEAIACGTQVITYQVGGSPETLCEH